MADQKSQDLPSEECGRPCVVEDAHPREGARLIHPALCHQEMRMQIKVDPVPEGLDGGDDAGGKGAPGRHRRRAASGQESDLDGHIPLESRRQPQDVSAGRVRHLDGNGRRSETPRISGVLKVVQNTFAEHTSPGCDILVKNTTCKPAGDRSW